MIKKCDSKTQKIFKFPNANAFKTGVQASKTNKRVVSNKDHVGGKIFLEKLGVWTRLLETREYTHGLKSL